MTYKIALAAILMFFSKAAAAQVPNNIFFGYSYMAMDTNSTASSHLHGWNASIEKKFLPFIGLVGDFSGHYGEEPNAYIGCIAVVGATCPKSVDANVHNFLIGPRISIRAGNIRPFAHILIGISRTSIQASSLSLSDTSFATATGGGVDFRITKLLNWRVQGDWLRTHFYNQIYNQTRNNIRISTGLDIHF